MTYSRNDLIAAARLSLTRAIDLIDDGDERCITAAARAAWEAFGLLGRADPPKCSICRRKHGTEVVHACE